MQKRSPNFNSPQKQLSPIVIPTGHIQTTKIIKNGRSRNIKKTGAVILLLQVEHRYIKPTMTRWRNPLHLNVVPTHKNGKFPSSTLAEPDSKGNIAREIFVVRGKPPVSNALCTTPQIKIGRHRGKSVRTEPWQ